MNKTKKLPVSISYGDYKTNANEFLVPDPSRTLGFIGIKTGREYRYGAISYIGAEITPKDIIDKMKQNGLEIFDEGLYVVHLEHYINEIYNYKISNIVEIESNEEGHILFKKVANRPLKNPK